MVKKIFSLAAVLGFFLGCTEIPDELRNEANGGGDSSSYEPHTPINLDPPIGIVAQVNSTNSISIGWGIASGATGYYIYRSTSLVGVYEQVGSSATTSYTDNNLSDGTTYYYRISSHNNKGEGSQSNYIQATTQPVAPTGVTATVSSTASIIVSWSSVTSAISYRVYCSIASSDNYELVSTQSTTSYTHSSLTAGTTYYYKVAAVNSGGEGSKSDVVFATTPPLAPTDVTAKANSASSITIDWSSVTSAVSYNIYRGATYSGTYELVGTSATASYENIGLTANTAYYYKVAAVNSGGESPQSSYVTATTLLAAPTGVTAVANSTSSITISWSSVAGATGYRVYRSGTSDGTYTEVGSSSSTSYTNTGLTAGTTFYYKVAAYNSGGEGSKSNMVSVATYVSIGGQIYKTVVIGLQTWMAENLNYAVNGSKCYAEGVSGVSTDSIVSADSIAKNCTKYGRLYDWATAMGIDAKYNSEIWNGNDVNHQGICPDGWHIPSVNEWKALFTYIETNNGCTNCAAKHLKTSEWGGLNSYGFSALPGGCGYSDGSFCDADYYSNWWSASEYDSYNAYTRYMYYYYEESYWYYFDKDYLYSVRCLQD